MADLEGKILIVDDEEDILDLLEYNLAKAGFVVERAQNGKRIRSKIS